MKLIALATPLLVLGLVLLLQRMEAWCVRAPRAADSRLRSPGGRTPHPTRSSMSTTTAPSPAATAEEAAAPLLRDPPSPPGYVDPLEGNATLEDIVDSTPRTAGSSDVPSSQTG